MTIINGYQVYVSIVMSEDSQFIPGLQRIYVESHPFSTKDEWTKPVMTSNSKCCVQSILPKKNIKRVIFFNSQYIITLKHNYVDVINQ